MQGRTVILVSHHVQLCAPGAGYVVALDNGRVTFQGSREEFQNSGVMGGLVQSTTAEILDLKEETAIGALDLPANKESDGAQLEVAKAEKKPARKFFEDEQRAVGRVAWSVWKSYILACGSASYWALFALIFAVAALAPLAENGWLSYWSRGDDSHSPLFYLSIYAAVSLCSSILCNLIQFLQGYDFWWVELDKWAHILTVSQV